MAASKGDSKLPKEVAAIRSELSAFLNQEDSKGRKIGSSKHGIYAFFDYDEEPIYTGQTYESLRSRIGRHLTNQRTDAVAMSVLDPFEVAYVEVWPLDDLIEKSLEIGGIKEILNRAEFTVFQQILANSKLGAVLNEKPIVEAPVIELPESYRGRIIPDEVFERRKHPDIRIARRATTIAQLARVISERNVSAGLRRTLLTQARRLELLSKERTEALGISDPSETGD
jgi:hypothetical protein